MWLWLFYLIIVESLLGWNTLMSISVFDTRLIILLKCIYEYFYVYYYTYYSIKM